MNKFKIYVILTIALILTSYWCANALDDSVTFNAITIWLAGCCLASGVLGLVTGVSAITEIE